MWGVTWFSLFESQRGVPDNEGLKGYELKDSFMGGEEADLAMHWMCFEKMGAVWRSSMTVAA